MGNFYKKLNEELIRELQNMKIQVAIYQKELNELRNQLLDERALRIEQEQKFLVNLLQNFRAMVLEVKPGADLSNLMRIGENYCPLPADEGNAYSSTNHRRASSILENLRRSNNLESARRSIVTMSPIPHRRTKSVFSSDSAICENNLSMDKSPALKEQSHARHDTVEMEKLAKPQNVDHNSLEEDAPLSTYLSTEESSGEGECDDKSSESDKEADKFNVIDDVETEILNSISNLVLEDIYEDEESENEENTIEGNKTHTAEITEEPTIKSNSKTSKSSLNNITNFEGLRLAADLNDSSPFVTNRNHKSPICSTPCKIMEYTDFQSDVMNRNANSSVSTITTTELELDTTTTQRPQRKCKPTDLKERSIKLKIRNESSVGLKKLNKKAQKGVKNKSVKKGQTEPID